MTEQEARTLASEFEHHKEWRVIRVSAIDIGSFTTWAVTLHNRRDGRCISLTIPTYDHIASRLTDGESDIAFH